MKRTPMKRTAWPRPVREDKPKPPVRRLALLPPSWCC